MKQMYWIIFSCTALGVMFSSGVYAETTSSNNNPAGILLWQAVKTPAFGIHIRITISDMTACSLKGPGMADYSPAEWIPERNQWSLQILPLSLFQLQYRSLGTWEMKLTNANGQDSIYSFTISGTLQNSEFLPVPMMIEPSMGATNVIAEHYTIQWNPNGANSEADLLIVDVEGNGYRYHSEIGDMSVDTWKFGWLHIGNAFCKIGYVKYRPDMIDTPSLISGPAIDWTPIASLVSGPKTNFKVKYSLDFTEDGHINLSDLAALSSLWSKPAPCEGDFDDNGIVDITDLAIFTQHWLEYRP